MHLSLRDSQIIPRVFILCKNVTTSLTQPKCLVSGSLRTASQSLPTFTDQPQSTTVDAGQSVQLSCKATSSKTITYTWEKDDSTLQADGRVTIAKDGTLAISKVEFSDRGNYVCVATVRDNGQIRAMSKTAKLTVRSKFSTSVIYYCLVVTRASPTLERDG